MYHKDIIDFCIESRLFLDASLRHGDHPRVARCPARSASAAAPGTPAEVPLGTGGNQETMVKHGQKHWGIRVFTMGISYDFIEL